MLVLLFLITVMEVMQLLKETQEALLMVNAQFVQDMIHKFLVADVQNMEQIVAVLLAVILLVVVVVLLL